MSIPNSFSASTRRRIRDQYFEETGRDALIAEEFLEWAKDPTSPAHNFFEWNNDKASHHYRLGQVRTFMSFRIEATKVVRSEVPGLEVTETIVQQPAVLWSKNEAVPSDSRRGHELARVRMVSEGGHSLLSWVRRYRFVMTPGEEEAALSLLAMMGCNPSEFGSDE